MSWIIRFDSGSLVVEVGRDDMETARQLLMPQFVWDGRICAFRASALRYRKLIADLTRRKIPFSDEARAYETLQLSFQFERVPFYYQQEALDAWEAGGGCGIVVLPTGAGKSYVAQMAILRKQRSALIITPTLDLMAQWHANITMAFGCACGLMGGGHYDIQPLTVTTYDSAYIHMEHLGNRFGMLIFDEVHHLPTSTYALGALQSIAPYRLGLTATPERDAAQFTYEQLVGECVYAKQIRDLAGENLAEYQTIPYEVELNEEEREAYEECRACYLSFIRANKIRMGTPDGWREFLRASSRSAQGRLALEAHRRQHRITQQCAAKLELLKYLLAQHRKDRTIIFTADNATVYQISRQYLIPAITHLSRVAERKNILNGFRDGLYPVIVTSKVLNEGVDIPNANIAIVLSGSGSVREHVQRLGRILRAAKNKQATLYELIVKDTTESFTSMKRRQHDAF